MSIVKEYWDNRYSHKEMITHHAVQNMQISRDFLNEVRKRSVFATAMSCERIIEIGCGTGDLAAKIRSVYNTPTYYATDSSRAAVNFAQRRHPQVNFWVFDVLTDSMKMKFDLSIASNVVEHFREPYAVIDRMLLLASRAMVVIPYKQPVKDDYDGEGGAGHVAEFSEKTFKPYEVEDSFTFETKGWQHSSAGETPLQLAVLLRAKTA